MGHWSPKQSYRKVLPTLEGLRDDLPGLIAAEKKLRATGDPDRIKDYWEVGPWKVNANKTYGKYARYTDSGKIVKNRMPAHLGADYGLSQYEFENTTWYDLAKLSGPIQLQEAAAMRRRIAELQGFEAAGGEQQYREQQRASELLRPQQQREAARSAEKLRSTGGGGARRIAASAPRDTGQTRSAEDRRRLTGRDTAQSGGLAKRRLRSRRAREILEPLGLTGGQSAGSSAVLG